ncbi:MAG: sulfatase-like hydrolase/transferase [Deltaproteobacteria bacterium]|nr:sulfatase-like hydrolase/transferase [Deltaproteobacteria bacterium]
MRRALLPIAAVAMFTGAAVLYHQLARPRVNLPSERALKPYYRLVDVVVQGAPGQGRVETHDLPAAAITDETRYVLAAPRHARVLLQTRVGVPADGRLVLSAPVPEILEPASRIVIMPQARIGGRWTKLPVQVVGAEAIEGRQFLRVELELPGPARGAQVDVHVDGYVPAEGSTSSVRTAVLPIPPGAEMELAFGILEPAWSQGSVSFSVSACEQADCAVMSSDTLDPGRSSGQGWQHRRLSLAALAGKSVAFVFDTAHAAASERAFSFPVWANPTVYVPSARSRDDVNVILLSIDTLRAQQLPSYGCRYDTAPFIAETFGNGGATFERLVAASATTPPSHMTMFTAVQPCVHGVKGGLEVIPPWLVTVAEVLRAAGFETGAVTEDGALGMSPSFRRGFNTYSENKSADVWFPEGQVDLTFRKAAQWLAQNRDRRFFLFLHTFQVHAPYAPPAAYQHLFTKGDAATRGEPSPPPNRDLIAYSQEMRYTDDELRALLAALAAEGLGANTIFILLSDHGEEFREHGLQGHGDQLYEEVSHVPLMLWGPGHIPAGRRIRVPVGHVDLMPTILELAGVKGAGQGTGTSLVSLLRDPAAEAALAPRALFAEAALPSFEQPHRRPTYMMQIGTRKFLRSWRGGLPVYECYDLAADAGELRNLCAASGKPTDKLAERLDHYEEDCRAQLAGLAQRAAQPVGVAPAEVHLAPEHEEKLRALGYLP